MVKKEMTGNKGYGSIFNNDINNIAHSLDGKNVKPEDYLACVNAILDSRPGIFAQNVGLPEAVIFETSLDCTLDKHMNEVSRMTWPGSSTAAVENETDVLRCLFKIGSDPLKITVGACREYGTKVVASFRMNSEDWYDNTWLMSDFGRMHPEYRIKDPDNDEYIFGHKKQPGNEMYYGCLDPAIPEVYRHRMGIFREVAEKYDIDGIEFDFRRWTHMVSYPMDNHTVLTRMIRDTRDMLEEIAAQKGRERMIIGVRTGPSIAAIGKRYDGDNEKNDFSSLELGLDVKTWISEGIMDYICPSLFWPRWPGLPDTSEFADLVKSKDIGVYPTLFPLPSWLSTEEGYKGPIEFNEKEKMQRYKDEFCTHALKLYEDGADGISTYNWFFHISKANKEHVKDVLYGPAGFHVQEKLLSILGYPREIKDFKDLKY